MKVACYCVPLARHHIIRPTGRRLLVRSERKTKTKGEVHEDDHVTLIVKVQFSPPACTFVGPFAGSDACRRRNWNLITPNMQEGILGSNWSGRGDFFIPHSDWYSLTWDLKPKISAAEGCTRTHCLRNGWRERHERNTPGSTRASDVGRVCLFVEGARGHVYVPVRAVTDLWEHDCTLLMRCCSTALLICLSLGRNCETWYSTIGFHLIFQKQF